jgi:hypothetical protein
MKTVSQNNVVDKKSPKLFISFSLLMSRLAEKKVTWADLSRGLFYFGCTREHVINPGANGEYVEMVVEENSDVLSRLQKAVLKAEKEGRVAWRKRDEHNSYEQLDGLLVSNGFKPLAEEDSNVLGGDRSHYNYSSVQRRSKELEVVG